MITLLLSINTVILILCPCQNSVRSYKFLNFCLTNLQIFIAKYNHKLLYTKCTAIYKIGIWKVRKLLGSSDGNKVNLTISRSKGRKRCEDIHNGWTFSFKTRSNIFISLFANKIQHVVYFTKNWVLRTTPKNRITLLTMVLCIHVSSFSINYQYLWSM